MKNVVQKCVRSLTADLPRKLFALVLAVFLYFAISDQLKDSRSLTEVPLEVQVENGLIGASRIRLVEVSVQGPRADFDKQKLDPKNFAGRITIHEENRLPDGRYMVTIHPKDFRSSGRMRVVGVAGKDVRQYFDDIQHETSKRVPVRALFAGSPSMDYEVADSRCLPQEVQIRGPELSVNAYKEICTEAIPLSNSVTESFERDDVQLNVLPEITVDHKVVTVRCEIVARTEESTVFGVPVVIPKSNNAALGDVHTQAPDATVSVEVRGAPSRIAELKNKPSSILITADLSGIDAAGTYDVPLIYAVSQEGVSVRKITPERIRVIVKGQSILKTVF